MTYEMTTEDLTNHAPNSHIYTILISIQIETLLYCGMWFQESYFLCIDIPILTSITNQNFF